MTDPFKKKILNGINLHLSTSLRLMVLENVLR